MALPASWYDEAIGRVLAAADPAVSPCWGLQTSGVGLNERWLSLIRRHRIGVGVSLDGPADLHDRARVTSGGKGTHALALRAVRRLQDADLPFHVITVLTRPHLAQPDRLFDFHVETGIRRVCFNVEEIEGVNRTSSLDFPGVEQAFRAFLQRFLARWAASPGLLWVREIEEAIALIAGTGSPFVNEQAEPLAAPSIAVSGEVASFSPELLGLSSERHGTFGFGNLLGEPFAVIAARIRHSAVAAEIASGVAACRKECGYFPVCDGALRSTSSPNTAASMRRRPFVEVETALRVGVFLGKTEQTEPSGQGRHTKVGKMPEEPALERFQQVNRYRSVLREERTRAMLDDRHDIDGNTPIQLNFDATVISPGVGTGPLAVLRAARLGLGSSSVAAAVIKVSRDPTDSETNAWSLYRDWIAVMERELAFAIRQRADALASAVKPVPATVIELLGQLRAAVCADLLAVLRDEAPRGMEAWPIRLERCLDAVGGMPSSANDSASLALRIVDRWGRLAARDFEKEARRRYQVAVDEALKLPYLRVLERAYETWRKLQTDPNNIDSFPEVMKILTSFDARRDDIACGGPLLTPQFGPEGKFVDLNGRFAFLLGLDLPLGEDGDKAPQRHEWTEPEPHAGNDGAAVAPAQHQRSDTPPST